ncbi:MAG: 30S ribosomal protein S9 [Candidatus Andersenbacteria bacterium]|nr:30S ribosomal protein S9 [Candidatus Andersenbacteria bacterium]
MNQEIPRGLGRRKTSVVTVRLISNPATHMVNGKPAKEYFPTVAMQAVIAIPLHVTSQADVFGFEAKALGGGKNSQAQALQLAIARALLADNPARRRQLRDSGLLTRDSRIKERKKPGLKRARRAPQFSKR